MDANQKTQVVERLRQAQNVLIAVSDNPSVDQLSSAIGLTLMMNKLGKHATAVFSGTVPSTLEFLQPETTLEQNTDSLRDFIISLDKTKADKLRYKVEENVVKIFITPYRTSLSEADLNFEQGDFNVDVVMALGVDQQEHLDQAIMAHGRILHDATVIGVMANAGVTNVGSINWIDPTASSLCEMLVSISESFQGGLLDGQMATAFLTGIVAETDRFSNEKTTSKVMTMAAQLMAAGANQQLISTKLALPVAMPEQPQPLPEATAPPVPIPPVETKPANEGTISLHEEIMPPVELPPAPIIEAAVPADQHEIKIDEQGTLYHVGDLADAVNNGVAPARNTMLSKGPDITPPSETPTDYSGYMTKPPAMGGTLTANSQPEPLEPSIDPLSAIPEAPIPSLPEQNLENPPMANLGNADLSNEVASSPSEQVPEATDTNGRAVVQKSMSDLEASVKSSEPLSQPTNLDAEAARQAVTSAVEASYDPDLPPPLKASNATRFDQDELNPPPVPPPLVPPFPSAPADKLPVNANDNHGPSAPDMPIPASS